MDDRAQATAEYVFLVAFIIGLVAVIALLLTGINSQYSNAGNAISAAAKKVLDAV
jgi:Flp pilus assembly pilin Flp